MHVYSDHRHPGAKKRPANKPRDCRKFPLIVGPHSSMQQQKYFSTSGMDMLETRKPESQPSAALTQGKLYASFELIQR